jgi:hypothetical protein
MLYFHTHYTGYFWFIMQRGRRRIPPPSQVGGGKERVCKLAQIFSTGTLDYIIDDSGERDSLAGLYRPVQMA